MASEVRRDLVLANFRQRGLKPRKRNSDWREKRPGMSEKHCANIRKLPCLACGKRPAGTIHHLKSHTQERGMSVRSTDKWGVPLCPIHHEEIEKAGTRREVDTFKRWGIEDVHAVAVSLWSAADINAMLRIVLSNKGEK